MAGFRFSKEIVEADHGDKWEPYFINSLVIEIVFLIYFLMQFFKEFKPVGTGDGGKTVRIWSKIIINYIQGEFIWDFIPLLPFQFLRLFRKRDRLLFLIKCLRLRRGF